MGSPTPSLDSISGLHSVGSLMDHHDYQSLSSSQSPLTSSPNSLSSIGSHNNGLIGGEVSDSILNSIMNGAIDDYTIPSNASQLQQKDTFCGLCHETYSNPKVLPCMHTYCESCIERSQHYTGKIICVKCNQECVLTSRGMNSLSPNTNVSPESPPAVEMYSGSACTNCKILGSIPTSFCFDCNHHLCQECSMAHQLVNYDGHRLYSFSVDGIEVRDGLISGEKKVYCVRHKTDDLKYFCLTCNIPICRECTMLEHVAGLHEYELISEVGHKQVDMLNRLSEESKIKAGELQGIIKNLDYTAGKLQVQFHNAQHEVNETFVFYKSVLEERKHELLRELESIFTAKQLSINAISQKIHDTVEKIYQTCDFVEKLFKCASLQECMVFKKLLDAKLRSLISYNPEVNLQNVVDLEFLSNYQAIQVGIRNTFGYVRANGSAAGDHNDQFEGKQQPPICRPTNVSSTSSFSSSFMTNNNGNLEYANNSRANSLNGSSLITGSLNGSVNSGSLNGSLSGSVNGLTDKPYANSVDINGNVANQFTYDSTAKRYTAEIGGFGSFNSNPNGVVGTTYEKWSNGGGDIFQNGATNEYSSINGDSMNDLATKMSNSSLYPPKSQIKRHKMIYHCKFGEFGAMESQFTEPSGVAVNAQNDIIVADTNNHRIQIFDKEGRFKFQFGECGKRDGQLLYPNRVAVIKMSGDIIVTERSPTHQIQIYNQYGQFVRKFGATTLQHPRGIAVDNKGRIIVVECKVMRVIIFDQVGNVLQKFGCSKHLEFPNGVVVNDMQEIFISDNRAHCVKVFNYDGMYLRQIGSEGITNYPIGVGINETGEILIADNHNNFNLTVFTQEGHLVSALESKVKHAQCFDVALMDDGSVVLASKDYRLYIYRYLPPVSPINI